MGDIEDNCRNVRVRRRERSSGEKMDWEIIVEKAKIPSWVVKPIREVYMYMYTEVPYITLYQVVV